MATTNERLAASLTVLRELQKDGQRVFQSQDISRTHRERLLRNGFVQEVMKGWLISSSPNAGNEDSTPWYASYWEFCARYCGVRFGDEWCLSPEQSILLQAEQTVVPSQVIVLSPNGSNHKLTLLFGSSMYDLKQARMPSPPEITVKDGLRIFTPAAALVRVADSFITRNPIETRVVLASVRDTADLLRHLLEGGHSIVAGRLAGGLRSIGRSEAADEIISTMKSAGYVIREADPFAEQPKATMLIATAPIVGRMHAMWGTMRASPRRASPEMRETL